MREEERNPANRPGPMVVQPQALNCCQAVMLEGFHNGNFTLAGINQAAKRGQIAMAIVLSGQQAMALEALEKAGFKRVASYTALDDGKPAYLMVKAPNYHMVNSLKSMVKRAIARKPRKSR